LWNPDVADVSSRVGEWDEKPEKTQAYITGTGDRNRHLPLTSERLQRDDTLDIARTNNEKQVLLD